MTKRREKDTELYALARDLSVSDAELARHADALTKRMTPISREFVICFAGIFREHAKQAFQQKSGTTP